MPETRSALVAHTSYGPIRGATVLDGLVFKGVPYAAPPVGSRRFRPPEPPQPWDRTRDCLEFGPSPLQGPCAQSLFAPIARVASEDEDCLTLNIWTPGLDDEPRPVMVWIYGGGFLWGSTTPPVYDGAAFARDGVVFVSINYRLNAFGFLCLDQLFDGVAGSGNTGILDQVRALEWVRDNIASFGGDPSNVTVFGESAGACCVTALLAAPAATGLFRRAIVQSGTTTGQTLEGATAITRWTLQSLGVREGDLDGLQSVPARRLLELVGPLMMEAAPILGDQNLNPVPLPFLPVIDGEVLVGTTESRISGGSASGVDILMGWCADELTAYLPDFEPPVLLEMFRFFLAGALERYGINVQDVIDVYREMDTEASDLTALFRAMSDVTFRAPTLQLAACQSKHRDEIRLFEFAWSTPVHSGRLGAPHTIDIPFVFDRLVAPELHGPNPPSSLASSVHHAWVSFSRTGDPDIGVHWPTYSQGAPQAMAIDESPRVIPAIHPTIAELWGPLLVVPAGS